MSQATAVLGYVLATILGLLAASLAVRLGAAKRHNASLAEDRFRLRDEAREARTSQAAAERREGDALAALESSAPAVRQATEALQEAMRDREAALAEREDAHRRRIETAHLLHQVIHTKEAWKKRYIACGQAFSNAQEALWREVEFLAILAGRKPKAELLAIMEAATATHGLEVGAACENKPPCPEPHLPSEAAAAAMTEVATRPGPGAVAALLDKQRPATPPKA